MLVRSDGFLSRYANARADELIARSAVTLDPDDRAAVLQELQQVLRDDPAGLYLWSAADLYGVGPRVNNWRPHPTERLIVAGVFVE
jgi:ABC-type dipeptide transport system, periplasmic component